jgi:hypothetical protein
VSRQNLARNYLKVEDNITIVCNDLYIIQHAIRTVVSGDVTDDISMGKDCLIGALDCVQNKAAKFAHHSGG